MKLQKYLSCTKRTYTLATDSYRKLSSTENIAISYPQLKGMDKLQRQNEINHMIEEKATAILEEFGDYAGAIDNNLVHSGIPILTVDITYDVKLSNDKILSMVFSGYSNVLGSAHPLNQYYTLNIDLEEVSIVEITDIMDLTSDFIKSIRSACVPGQEPAISLQAITDDKLLKLLYDAECQGIYWHMAREGICLSFPVSHAGGDHAEVSISFDTFIHD